MNDQSTLFALGSAVATVVVFAGGTLALYVLGSVVGETYLRASRHESARPQPVLLAFVGALGEVLVARPLRLHRSRMEVMRRMEADRADSIEAARLRHPAAYRARQAAMASHPSAMNATDDLTGDLTGDLIDVQGAQAGQRVRHLHAVGSTWDGGDAA